MSENKNAVQEVHIELKWSCEFWSRTRKSTQILGGFIESQKIRDEVWFFHKENLWIKQTIINI